LNIENALKIPGWTSEKELLWLAMQASTRPMVVEVGSWKGRSTRAIADNLPAGGIVYAVDTWNGTPEDVLHGQEIAGRADWLYNEFLNAKNKENCVAVRGASLSVVKRFDAGFFDMIFIDAAHDYDNVKADILAWRPLLKRGGLFCGHDFDAGRPGVVKAVRELIPNVRMAGAGSIWVAPC
jgi:predicted O-methyltransferase YrrM